MMEKFNGKKEKWTNKGTDKPYAVDSLKGSATLMISMLYQKELYKP